MRLAVISLLALGLFGCASHSPAVAPEQQRQLSQSGSAQSQQPQQAHQYAPSAAGALAFDPPVLAGMPKLDLSREGRDPAAFVGYEDLTTTIYDLQINDRQIDLGGDRFGNHGSDDYYQRDAASEKIGVSYR
jgi:hypothetical protein